MAKVAKWLKKARKLAEEKATKEVKVKSKAKVKKSKAPKPRKRYILGEVTFPIYVFNSKLVRTVKIKNEGELQYMGLHLATILTCVRDGTTYSKHYFSYNKSFE